jgi:UDP-N-acetylglucosamine 4,6-dehydratase/5-epimerase
MKQVPTCEQHPMEAIRTNVLGVENMVKAAMKHKVQVFITISTDKAVKPVNVMGMTKALQERLVITSNLSRNNRGTRFACVRYGNVLRSRGSVVPFFRRQLMQGQTLSITDEKMTRFLLTLNDAIDLVLYAAENTQGGEVFIRKAPAATVLSMARVLSEEMNKPLDYKVIGTFPGEKFNEILISEEEMARAEDMGEYMKVNPWWNKTHFDVITDEYSSGDYLVDDEEVKRLIKRADHEFETMHIHGGEFSKF